MFIKINTYLINTKWHNVWHVLPFWGRGGGFKSWQFKTASEIMSTNVKKKILSGYFQRIFEKKNSNDILRIIQIWINKSIDFDTTFLYDQRFTVLWFFFIFLVMLVFFRHTTFLIHLEHSHLTPPTSSEQPSRDHALFTQQQLRPTFVFVFLTAAVFIIINCHDHHKNTYTWCLNTPLQRFILQVFSIS